jgi:signal transduction histidine kinase/CheY-like chemotaxis protein
MAASEYDGMSREQLVRELLRLRAHAETVAARRGTPDDAVDYRQLAQANDLARAESRAKDRFLAMLSHELRNPLTPILLTVEALERGMVPPERLAAALTTIRRNVEQEVRLIDDLLDLSRITHGKLRIAFEPVDLHAVVEDVVADAGCDAAAAGVSLRADLQAIARHVNGDPARLRQIVWNLVGNALQNTARDGNVEVSTRNTDDGITLVVRDSGRGIPPGLLPHIFEPFDQADRPGGPAHDGLGLGLAIARGLADAHGGRIDAASPGADLGATFTVALPTLPDAAEPTAAATGVAAQVGPLRILLVEDDADAGEALSLVLCGRGHQVRLAQSMAEALRHELDPFDVVVSDIRLPDGDGIGLFRRLRRRGPVRGIALSGFGAPGDVRRSLDAGFERHLTKPVQMDAFLAVVEAIPHAGGPRGLRRAVAAPSVEERAREPEVGRR